jgi:8-oxo-dGTP pyrophosphatase MutT (NUDIX family)
MKGGHGPSIDNPPAAGAATLRCVKTWDGLPISDEKPHGASVIVWRQGGSAREFVILHRRHAGGIDFEGDWAWTPPSGARFPGEALEDAARRELLEEAGLDLPFELSGVGSDDWAVFVAEAPPHALVALDDEHDRYVWLPAPEAAEKCLPPLVGRTLLAVDEWLDQTAGGR